MSRISIFGGYVHYRGDRATRAIIAGPNRDAVVRAINLQGQYMPFSQHRDQWSITRNAAEVAAATANPLVMLVEVEGAWLPWSR